jgi:signal transduction histidine kinase
LYVDDEPQNLFAFRYVLEDQFTVLTARDGAEAVNLLEQEDVAVLICDQRMPAMTGVEVCRRASEIKPDVVRIIMTAYADLQAAVDAINQGQVLRYLTKPWQNEELIEVLRSAIELVKLRRLVHDMQARVLRGGHPPVIEAVTRQIASELHAPLSSLEMNAEQVGDLLSAGLGSWQNSDRARQLVQHAHTAHSDSIPPIGHLRSIMQKLERGQRLNPLPAPVLSDAVRVVRATARILGGALEPSVRLQLVICASPAVGIDAAALGQALVHLVMNAAQALEAMSIPSKNVVTVQVAENAGNAEITVIDSGPGIAAELLERIFDPYFTTREGAAGLGLSMARHLIGQVGGTVSVDSKPGRGSRFTIRLPKAG